MLKLLVIFSSVTIGLTVLPPPELEVGQVEVQETLIVTTSEFQTTVDGRTLQGGAYAR